MLTFILPQHFWTKTTPTSSEFCVQIPKIHQTQAATPKSLPKPKAEEPPKVPTESTGEIFCLSKVSEPPGFWSSGFHQGWLAVFFWFGTNIYRYILVDYFISHNESGSLSQPRKDLTWFMSLVFFLFHHCSYEPCIIQVTLLGCPRKLVTS